MKTIFEITVSTDDGDEIVFGGEVEGDFFLEGVTEIRDAMDRIKIASGAKLKGGYVINRMNWREN